MARREMLVELLGVSALLICVGIAAEAGRRYLKLKDEMGVFRLSAARSRAQDRLIGTPIDLARLDSTFVQKAAPAKPLVLWVVDLEQCSACFGSVSEWRRLEQTVDHDLVLLLVGKPSTAVNARLRVLERTTVKQAQRTTVLSVIGPTLANTKLLVDSHGIALLVDSRASGQECGWSFEAQVAAISGDLSSTSIRTRRLF